MLCFFIDSSDQELIDFAYDLSNLAHKIINNLVNKVDSSLYPTLIPYLESIKHINSQFDFIIKHIPEYRDYFIHIDPDEYRVNDFSTFFANLHQDSILLEKTIIMIDKLADENDIVGLQNLVAFFDYLIFYNKINLVIQKINSKAKRIFSKNFSVIRSL